MNYYELLGITQLAGDDEISDAFAAKQKKALESHDGAIKETTLLQLDSAYSTLIDPDSRREYDENLSEYSDSEQLTHIGGRPGFNYAKFRTAAKTHWTSLLSVDASSHPAEVLGKLIDNVLYLPEPEIQRDFLVAALLTPSGLSDTLPLIFCFGSEGTGKSVICKIAGKLWGIQPLTSNATYAGIRNKISTHRWRVYEGLTVEENMVLVWNDISPASLDKNLISLLKCYNRDESIIEISGQEKNGQNITFDVFCSKIFSSVTPLFAMPEYAELTRRMIIFYCERATNEMASLLIPLTEIDFSGFSLVPRNYWESEENCQRFSGLDFRMEFRKVQFQVSIDVLDTCKNILKTGVTLGIWDSPAEAVEAFIKFVEFQQNLKINFGEKTKLVLQTYMKNQIAEKIKLGQKPTIFPAQIKSYLHICAAEGKIESNPQQGKIDKLLTSLGYVYNNTKHFWTIKE